MNQAVLEKLTLDAPSAMKVQQYLPAPGTLLSLADLFKVLSDTTRLKILSALSITPMCVGDISLLLGINQTTVSHQLKTLKDKGMVVCRKIGRVAYYSLSDPSIESILNVGAERISKRASYAV